MAKVKPTMAQGFANGDLWPVLDELVDDLTELRSKLIGLLQKLDSDAGVTDADYEATLTPAALKTTR